MAALIGGLGALALAGALLIHLRRPGPPPPPTDGALRVVTYNIHAGLGGLDRLAAEIAALAPDVVALQESERGVARSMADDQTARLAAALGMHHAFAPSIASSAEGDHGVAILSRFPLEDIRAVPLPQGRGRWPRVALLARVMAPDAPFLFACVHLSRPESSPLSLTGTRVAQIRTLLEALERSTLPRIVAGDLNSLPLSVELLVLRRQLRHAWHPWRDGWVASFPLGTLGWPQGAVPIDHVLHDREWKSVGTWVAPPGASDHLAVVADLVPSRVISRPGAREGAGTPPPSR
jgi:endonuclease/exonuclease/phosphatase family metal-dependent hydrolase